MDIKKLSKNMDLIGQRPAMQTPNMEALKAQMDEQKKQQETMLRLEALRLACSLPHEKSEEVLVTANSFMRFLNDENTPVTNLQNIMP